MITNGNEIKREIRKRGFISTKEWSDSHGLIYQYAVKTLNGLQNYKDVIAALKKDKFPIRERAVRKHTSQKVAA